MSPRLAVRLIVLVAAAMLGGCSPVLETDQARLCRMALPVLTPQETRIAILAQKPDADGRGLSVAFTADKPGEEPQTHLAACRFRMPGRPGESRDLTSLTLDGKPVSEARLFFLVRYWLATPQGRAADPAPIGDLSALPVVPHGLAYGLQMALDGLPLASIYALLAAAYSLIYALIGRINFAFGEIAAAGGYAAAIAALAMVGWPPVPLLTVAFVLAAAVASAWGFASAHVLFIPLRQARGQQVLVATVGLALFLRELLRLAQGDRSSWMSPQLNQPFALARSGDFVAVATPMAFVVSARHARRGLMPCGHLSLQPPRARIARLRRRSARRRDDGDQSGRGDRARLCAIGSAGWPCRRHHDGGIWRGRIRPVGGAHLEGAHRGDHRRHRLAARRFPWRAHCRRRRNRLVGFVPDRLSRHGGLCAADDLHCACAPPAFWAKARRSRTTYSHAGLDLA